MSPCGMASNWNSCYLDGIRNGISAPQNRSCCTTLTRCSPQPNCSATFAPVNECTLPPINMGGCSGNCQDSCACPPCYAFCVEKVEPIKPKVDEYQPPCVPFEGCSQYRSQYCGQYGPPAVSMKRDDGLGSSGCMSCCTHYRETFTCKPLCVERAYKNENYVPPCEPFNGCSTYRMDYVPKCCVKTMSAKPCHSGFSDAAFSGCTTYKNDYLPFYFKNCCPCPTVSCRPNCC